MTGFSDNLKRKIDYSVGLLQKAESLALSYNPDGFYLAFSGGKDSQTLFHIAEMAGVKFKAHMNFTSVDPPEVVSFVKRNYPQVERIPPRISIYEMAKKKHILPTRLIRWCCAEYKEISGAGSVTLLGIRHEESARRAKRNEFEIGREVSTQFDQWNNDKEQSVTCVGGKDKIMLSPIIQWTEKDVWEFLNKSGIPHCKLYDCGYRRIGCILCPMSQYWQKVKEIKDFPHVKQKWIATIQWLIDNGDIDHNFNDAELGFRWWISGKSFKQFYADEVLQQKLF